MKFAFIQNDKVCLVEDLESGEVAAIKGLQYQAVVEIFPENTVPEVGWEFVSGLIVNPFTDSKKVTKLKFLERFTTAELVGIEAYAAGTGANNLAVRVSLRKQSLATFIDLALPETISGTMALAALGLLTVERANQILNNPVMESERYRE